MQRQRLIITALALASGVSMACAQSATGSKDDPLSAYLADLSPGAVSAGEMLGLSSSAVTAIQAPKDFVAAVNALNSDTSAAGTGFSFTPGRTRIAPVSIADYEMSVLSRAWAGTTISVARNTNTQGGIDYRQEAYAIHVSAYLSAADDPAVAGHKAFANCDALQKAGDDRTKLALAIRKMVTDEKVLTDDAINEEVRKRLEKLPRFKERAVPLYNACMAEMEKPRWNASQWAATLGQGRVRDPAPGAPKLSLGRMASVSLALGFGADSLLNVTVRRTRKAVDVASIATTPVYKSDSLAGARFTYKSSYEDLYAVAEISNAKLANTSTSAIFKHALGIDYRLREGMWLEIRAGRNHTQDGRTEQTTTLMNFKLAPSSNLSL